MSNNEGWIEHDGKGMPLSVNGVLVDIMTKDGVVFKGQSLSNEFWKWEGSSFDIRAYKPHQNTLSLFDTGIADYA